RTKSSKRRLIANEFAQSEPGKRDIAHGRRDMRVSLHSVKMRIRSVGRLAALGGTMPGRRFL
ncbi:MAG TPA: hypothetical protein VKE53_10230, partial [Pseudolabrys sp.]|nr:hypothetical protein [Pseudolabrys sp.]